jgi:nifR3 family TIM-barrel protein
MKNFWTKLKRPFFCLAPMADVTDPAFRRIIAKYGKPGVFYTEFVSADGLVHPKGREKLLPLLQFSKKERPIVAQIFTAKPDKAREAAKIIADLGFDGLDINMGCPHDAVVKQNAGAALMKNPKLAREIIRAAKEGVENKIPVSVKTRLGFNKDELETWLPELLAEEPAAITVHARTRKEMSKAMAHWDRVKRAVEIRNELGSKTLIIGNGDAVGIDDARRKYEETDADGVMFGRAIFGNPWLFSQSKSGPRSTKVFSAENLPDSHAVALRDASGSQISIVLKTLLEHTKLFDKLCRHRSFNIMKKHFKAYVNGFPGASELRNELMEAENAKEVEKVIKTYLKQHPLTD